MDLSVASLSGFEHALASARTITLAAYTLGTASADVAALESAGERGAKVEVVLAGGLAAPDWLQEQNRRTARLLQAHGVHVTFSPAGERMHLKGALVDDALYLDGRNWNRADLLLCDRDPADASAFCRALAGRGDAGSPAVDGALAVSKGDALAREAALIANSPAGRIDVATESFGACVVSKALFKRLASGARVRLLVSSEELRGDGRTARDERKLLARLAAAGAEIREGRSSDKLCVAGAGAWLGSANATFPGRPHPLIDWGLASTEPAVVAAARARFESDWAAASSVPQDRARVLA